MKKVVQLLATTTMAAGLLLAPPSANAFDGWRIEKETKVDGVGSLWDYIAFDAVHQRLFIGHRKGGLEVFDIKTQKMIKTIDKTPAASSNGALLMPEFDLGISSNENGTIIPFKLSTLETKDPIKLGEELDTSHYDPATMRIFVNMAADKDGADIVVLQAPSLKQIGKIRLPTKKPEHAEADGKGNFYIASRDLEKVYRIDTKELKVTAEWPTPGCGQTNSLALDVPNKRILLGCRGNKDTKPSFAVMDMETGKMVYTAEIGGGNDGLIYDPELKRVFLSNGVTAGLHIFEQVDADNYKPLEALGTRAAVRTMAYNHAEKKIYTFTGEGSADYSKPIVTSVSPYYANTYFPNSFTVLTIGKPVAAK